MSDHDDGDNDDNNNKNKNNMNSSDEDVGHKAPVSVAVDSPSPSQDHEREGISAFDAESQRLPNGQLHGEAVVNDHDGDLVTAAENQDLKRGLAERHLTMLGIAGAIGTGLFLSLGGAIQTGGPLGALLGYAMVGGIVCAVQFALGEVTALLPVSADAIAPLPPSLRLENAFARAVADSLLGHWKLRPACWISR